LRDSGRTWRHSPLSQLSLAPIKVRVPLGKPPPFPVNIDAVTDDADARIIELEQRVATLARMLERLARIVAQINLDNYIVHAQPTADLDLEPYDSEAAYASIAEMIRNLRTLLSEWQV
jgi:hypothetical protein